MNSFGRKARPPTVSVQAPSSRTTRGAWSFSDSGNFSKKMSSLSEMWSSAENTSVPAGSPAEPDALPCRSFGAASPPGG